MPYRPNHKQKTREKIVQSARRVMSRAGFAETSIDDVMAEAGLTRGGFYFHFDSKQDLLTAVVREMTDSPFPGSEMAEMCRSGSKGEDRFSDFVMRYLSEAHRDRVDLGCSVPPLSPEISRAGDAVRQAFDDYATFVTGQVASMIGSDARRARETAIAVLALCVGGMVLSRAVHDPDLSDETLESCRAAALKLGRDARQTV